INKAKTEEELIEKLAVLRTIFVSLIYLVDQEAEAEYIQHLNTNYRSASVNRGFYRIYYGDLVSGIEKGALRYLDDDPDQSWSHTRESLIRSLNAYVASENEGNDISLGLSVFTLISFLYSRINKSHNASDFEEDYSVLKRCLTKIESNYLRNLVRGFLKDYEDGVFSVWDFVFSLYKLKTLQRQGWLDRGLSKYDLKSAESVADHGYLCCILAWLLLPEPGPSESYSKKTIIEMLMVHDIAEAYIGDQVTNSMSNEELQKYKLEESEAMSYLRTRDTYEEVSGAELAYLRWQEFDKDTESVNASLAKDFDRLENLVQLELYRSNLNQDEYHKFRKSLVDQLKMPQVQRLASSLVGWIDSGHMVPSASPLSIN
ncbi:MAG: HD domain-containing protein, partial [Candidatus Thiodiazotropha sp.]